MNSLLGLEGKKILIVGATAGIIRPLIPRLKDLRANIYCTTRNTGKLFELFPSVEKKSIFEMDLVKISEDTIKSMPQFDGVLFSIGLLNQKPFKFLSMDDFRSTFETNFFSQINLLRLLVLNNKLASDSSVVFISSLASHKSDIGLAAYSASKGAIDSCIRPLALELGKRKKIRVNSICPGFVKTDLSDSAKDKVGIEGLNKHLENYVLGDITADDICGHTIYLLSDLSRKMTGKSLILDSGFLC